MDHCELHGCILNKTIHHLNAIFTIFNAMFSIVNAKFIRLNAKFIRFKSQIRIQTGELHGCIRANGPGATVICNDTTITGSQRPGVSVSGGAWAELSGGSIEACGRGLVVSGSGRVVADAKMIQSGTQ